MPIPIKNPNISTNRYKELLRIEKYYKKYQDKYYKEFKENQQLKDNIYELQERIEEAVEILKLCNSNCSKETIKILEGE